MKSHIGILAAIVATLMVGVSIAQIDVVAVEQEGAGVVIEYQSTDLSLPAVGQVLPQPMLIGSGNAFYGGWSAGGNDFGILHDPSVRKDLEVVDDQYKQISNIQQSYMKQMQSTMKEYSQARAKGEKEKIKDISLQLKKLREDQKKELAEVLLPHQLDRIKQVSRQMQMQNMGTAGALRYGKLAKELEITDEQKKKLAKIEQEMKKVLQEKMAELKADAKEKMLKELTSGQRARLKELTGDEFKRNPKDYQQQYERTKKEAAERKNNK